MTVTELVDQQLVVGPADALVLRLDPRAHHSAVDDLLAQIDEHLPHLTGRIIILSGVQEMAVLRSGARPVDIQDPGPEPEPCWAVLTEVAEERARQDTRWGEQNHPDGTGGPLTATTAQVARSQCQDAAEQGNVTWRDILREEVAEAMAESDPVRLRDELVQVAAVAVNWAEAIDRRQAKAGAA